MCLGPQGRISGQDVVPRLVDVCESGFTEEVSRDTGADTSLTGPGVPLGSL